MSTNPDDPSLTQAVRSLIELRAALAQILGALKQVYEYESNLDSDYAEWVKPSRRAMAKAKRALRATRHYESLLSSGQRSREIEHEQETEQDARMDTKASSDDSRTAPTVAPGTVTEEDLDNIRHMLGSERVPGGFRNYFVAGSDNVASMERLRAAGLVVKNERYALSSDPCYHATIEGAKAIGLKRLP